MNFSYRDVLMVLYCGIAILGVVFLGFSWYCWKLSIMAEEPVSYWIASIVLLIVGIALIMFGLETYIFRDDPDVWR